MTNFLFFCYNNYSDGVAICVPFEYHKEFNAFNVAQHIYKRVEKYLCFDEVLRYLNDTSRNVNVHAYPFGYDGDFSTVYIHNYFFNIEEEWKTIYKDQQTFIPVPYVTLNGVAIANSGNINDKSKLHNEVTYKIYSRAIKNKNDLDEAAKNEIYDKIVHLMNNETEFEFMGQHVMTGNFFETFEDLVKALPKYKAEGGSK